MLLDKAATTDFVPESQFSLEPGNAEPFMEMLRMHGNHFAYSLLLSQVPMECTFDVADPNAYPFSKYVSLLKDWNKVDSNVVQKNATMTWGDLAFHITTNKQIVKLSQTCGEIDAGVCGGLNPQENKCSGKRWHQKFLHQALALFDPRLRRMIMVNKDELTWFNDKSCEEVYGGLTILYFTLQMIWPNIKISIYNEIEKLKQICSHLIEAMS